MKTSLVIFTLNEIKAVSALFNRIPFSALEETLVIDGGSTDGTIDFFLARGIKVITQKIPGHGEAYKLGLEKASGEAIVFFGCDGNNYPEDIPLLAAEINHGSDLAIASRFSRDSESMDATWIRRLGNQFFVFLVNLRWRTRLTDVFNEFRAVRKEAIKGLDLKNSYFDLELEMVIKAIKHKLRISELPTVEYLRIEGQAKLSTLRAGWMNLKCFLREAF
jgi:glycosyltransferase involved in cell wall biosynthesis